MNSYFKNIVYVLKNDQYFVHFDHYHIPWEIQHKQFLSQLYRNNSYIFSLLHLDDITSSYYLHSIEKTYFFQTSFFQIMSYDKINNRCAVFKSFLISKTSVSLALTFGKFFFGNNNTVLEIGEITFLFFI